METLGSLVEKIHEVTGADPELVDGFIALPVSPPQVVRFLSLLKERLGFEILTDLFVIDRTRCRKRFAVVILVTSLTYRATVGVQTEISEKETLDSLELVYPSSVAFEKASMETFGVTFRRRG